MLKTALRIDEMVESETLAMTRKARELKEAGHDVINLSIGEPDFDTPDHIKEAAMQAIRDNHSHYTPVPGYPDFREAIVRKFKRDNGLDYSIQEIIVSTGAKQSLVNLMLAMINPGDEVIIPAPYWVSYPAMVEFAGGVPVILPTTVENDFKPTVEQIAAAITPKTTMFLFSSPCNPSGTVFTESDLLAWAEVFRQHPEMLIVSDEIYEQIQFEGRHISIATLPGFRERTAVVNGLSKGYAMTGWRIGYLAGPAHIVRACEKIQGVFTSGANSIAQKAGIAALDGDQTPSWQMRDRFLLRRDAMLKNLQGIPGLKMNVPPGAFYLFPEVKAYFGKRAGDRLIGNASELAMYLLEVAHVATVAGDAFGSPDCLRLSYATDEASLARACERIKSALSRLES
jgi:aspartate aminotransferase